MWMVLVALILGLVLGFHLPLDLPTAYGRYLSIAILAALDSAFGGIRASQEGNFESLVFLSGFFANALVAALLTYLGDQLGVELYYAALFAFGYRLFQNLGIIRRLLLRNYRLPDEFAIGRPGREEKSPPGRNK